MRNRAKIWLRIIAAIELSTALAGLFAAIVASRTLASLPVLLLLLYGVLALVHLAAGILLWRLQYKGIELSLLLQLIQVPYFTWESFPYQPMGLNFVIKAGWFREGTFEAHEIGINFLALGLYLVLLRCKHLWQPAAQS